MTKSPRYIISNIRIALDNAPEHAAALGRLLGHWAMFEKMLIGLMQYLLQIKPNIAAMIYDEFVSTKAKILLLRRVNHHFTTDISLKIEIETILSVAQQLNTKRNSFIHASWATVDSSELIRFESILLQNHKKTYKIPTKFTPEDIQNVVEEIAKLSASLGSLLIRLLEGPL